MVQAFLTNPTVLVGFALSGTLRIRGFSAQKVTLVPFINSATEREKWVIMAITQ